MLATVPVYETITSYKKQSLITVHAKSSKKTITK